MFLLEYLMLPFVFWAAFVAINLFLLLTVSTGKTFWSLVFTVLFIGSFLIPETPLQTFFTQLSLIQMAELIGIYVASGILVGTWKWWVFCRQAREKYITFRSWYLKSDTVQNVVNDKNIMEIPDHFKAAFKKEIEMRELIPQASENKATIIEWMIFWPWYAIVTLIDDPIRALFTYIYNRITGILQRIANSVFKEFKNDLN